MGQSGAELCTMLWLLGRCHWLLRAFLFGLLCSLVAAPLGYGQIAGQIAESPTPLPSGGPAVELTVPPSSTRNPLLSVPQRQTVVLSFEELQQTSVVIWTDSQGKVRTLRTNRSGQSARIRFALTEYAIESERFAVTVGSVKRAAHLLISASVLMLKRRPIRPPRRWQNPSPRAIFSGRSTSCHEDGSARLYG
jgi:hypothetical protein